MSRIRPLVIPPKRRASRRGGFALLITVTLLAFLVILLVSLASLTRVETQVASNTQQLAQARQNALLALNVALGRLQALAGPDQRITATADIVAGRNLGKKYWTGVWNTTVASPAPEWLVSTASGTAPTGTSGVASPLAAGTVTLVGSKTTDTTNTGVTGNAVVVETQPITAGSIPGFSGPQTIGNFAYWVGDEGVKAKVSLADPWANPSAGTLGATAPATTAAQAQAYSLVGSQRFGIEGVDTSAGAKLAGAYPAAAAGNPALRDAFTGALPKVLSLAQLPLANIAGEAALTDTVKTRFHDLTASSHSVLSDVAKGGLKKDLTAWIADPAAPSNPVSANASDDYITPGNPADTGKYGLPKWSLIRSYATTYAGYDNSPITPQVQTPSRQGIAPVITYARMGYNLSMDSATGIYHINILPVVALWNPNNVPLQASTDDTNTYEFCFKYKPHISSSNPYDKALLMRMYFSDTALPPATNGLKDSFMPATIQIRSSDGVNTIYKSYAKGSAPTTSTGVDTAPSFWRFKVKLSKKLDPGESRIFLLDDNFNEQQYQAGVSELTDRDFGSDNVVYIPCTTPLTAAERAPAERIFWQTEPNLVYIGMSDIRLTQPVPASVSSLTAIDAFLTDPAHTYHAILGNGFEWVTNPNPPITAADIPEFGHNPGNTFGYLLSYQRVQLNMSVNPTDPATGSGALTSGTPRWLAVLNPQASVSLRKPRVAAPPANDYDRAGMVTPSYQLEGFVPNPARKERPLPNQSGNNVSAGTEVSNGNANNTTVVQNMVLREFQPDPTTLISLGQLQHVNASLINLNPAYPIGNSSANLYVPLQATESEVLPGDAYTSYSTNSPVYMDNTYPGFPTSSQFQHIYDLSYLLNKALWDGYFFSTVPQNVAATPRYAGQTALTTTQAADPHYHLPNARHVFYWQTGSANNTEVDDFKAANKGTNKAAAHLLVSGGFNVNSTSEQAWRAFLYSHPGDAPNKTALSRFAVPPAAGIPNNTWLGYRTLSDAQIDSLAKEIVNVVRNRGPFLSLADFVNRRLVANDTGLKGPLQTAIDAITSGAASTNGIAPYNSTSAMRVTDYPMESQSTTLSDPDQKAIYAGGTTTTLPSSSRAAFTPGYLTQADLLTTLGPSLSARSDTFRIRTYGDVVNPATGDTTPSARAWCEAIVQRLPDYVEPKTPISGNAPADALSALTSDNQTFGRRFKIVSFRWLTASDI